MTYGRTIGILAVLATLTACGPKEDILEGERFGVREAVLGETADTAAEPRTQSRKITLPKQVSRADMPQLGGNAMHLAGHDALAALPTRLWSTSIGAGDQRRHRITATPVIAGGRVFAMDSRSRVTAVSTGGAELWNRDLTLPGERTGDASGGGWPSVTGGCS
ncbi:Outer membrane protein YfgL [Rhodovulum sp. P5]|uniref:hypothetical protein n=1 Tax=Rhodovulum sp. P5 TaxID=1564506 RepID=UPI0009C2A614|nr:hypothetical protein [Rhodovulum sp. P5]ARE38507.1 Outer membrane protein YfgL [Rhodovulum sp. P5]